MGTDPVCGMKVPLMSPHLYPMNGSEVVFCSGRCHDRFAGDPSKYHSVEPHESPSARTAFSRAMIVPIVSSYLHGGTEAAALFPGSVPHRRAPTKAAR